MNDWSASQIRELIEQAIKAERNLRDRLRREDRDRFDEYKKTQAEALRINDVWVAEQKKEIAFHLAELDNAHARAENTLKTYVTNTLFGETQKAFNELKTKVDIELAARAERIKTVTTIFSVLSGAAVIISVAVAVLTYIARN